jgi:hypothetical protein
MSDTDRSTRAPTPPATAYDPFETRRKQSDNVHWSRPWTLQNEGERDDGNEMLNQRSPRH